MSNMRMTEAEALAYVDAQLKKAFDSGKIGVIPSREDLEASISKAVGMACKLPDYNEKTGEATELKILWPHPLNYIDITFEVEAAHADEMREVVDEVIKELGHEQD